MGLFSVLVCAEAAGSAIVAAGAAEEVEDERDRGLLAFPPSEIERGLVTEWSLP